MHRFWQVGGLSDLRIVRGSFGAIDLRKGYAAGEFPLWSLARFLGLYPIHFEQNVSGQVRLSPKETYAFTSDELMFLSTLIARARTSGIKRRHMSTV